jgi:hypothetical protein
MADTYRRDEGSGVDGAPFFDQVLQAGCTTGCTRGEIVAWKKERFAGKAARD